MTPKPKDKCPVCGKPVDEKYRPHCSKRCAYVDLGRWLDGSYRVPGEETVPLAGSGSAGDEEE
jgi:endogenous inhibitor of DNA gyrase (YacG/DUF329 family)